MKIHVWYDERYPDYGVSEASANRLSIEISDELFAEIKAVEAAYEAMQKTLRVLAKQQNGPLG